MVVGEDWTNTFANILDRAGHTSVVFDNKMWVMGGYDIFDGLKNDVWYSTDGITWTEATASASWSVRYEHSSVVFDNNIWVMGGDGDFIMYNDVWYSEAPTPGDFLSRINSRASSHLTCLHGCSPCSSTLSACHLGISGIDPEQNIYIEETRFPVYIPDRIKACLLSCYLCFIYIMIMRKPIEAIAKGSLTCG